MTPMYIGSQSKSFTGLAMAQLIEQGLVNQNVAVSFLIPTVILFLVYTQVKGFFGTRLNFTYQMVLIARSLGDIAVLMILGILPDYVQGLIKLFWVLTDKTRPA